MSQGSQAFLKQFLVLISLTLTVPNCTQASHLPPDLFKEPGYSYLLKTFRETVPSTDLALISKEWHEYACHHWLIMELKKPKSKPWRSHFHFDRLLKDLKKLEITDFPSPALVIDDFNLDTEEIHNLFGHTRVPHLKLCGLDVYTSLIFAYLKKHHTALQSLTIRMTYLLPWENTVKYLGHLLETHPSLRQFEMYGNCVPEDERPLFLKSVASASLTALRLQQMSLNDDEITILATHFKNNTLLTELDLKGNSIGFKKPEAIEAFLGILPNLTSLNLCNNLIPDSLIGKILKSHTWIKSLYLDQTLPTAIEH